MKKFIICILLLLSFSFSAFAQTDAEKEKFNSPEFEIPVTEFSPLGLGIADGTSTEAQANSILASIIRFLMILIGSCSLLVMTVGGGHMIVYHGNDEFLSRGKTIFGAGASGLVVALFSYYLVDLVSKLVY